MAGDPVALSGPVLLEQEVACGSEQPRQRVGERDGVEPAPGDRHGFGRDRLGIGRSAPPRIRRDGREMPEDAQEPLLVGRLRVGIAHIQECEDSRRLLPGA